MIQYRTGTIQTYQVSLIRSEGFVMQSWQMQTAKARFSELVKHAAQEGPQEITLHGQSVAVVVSRKLFDQLSGNEQSLVDFMRASPLAGREDVDLERDRGPGSLPRELRF